MRLVKLLLELGAVYILLGERQGTNKRPLLADLCPKSLVFEGPLTGNQPSRILKKMGSNPRFQPRLI
jgi:hypothetical protein